MSPSPEVVDRAITSAPSAVQKYINDGLLAEQVVAIGEKHQLHVDAIGSLAELSRNMLVGVSSPAEVLNGLVSAGVGAPIAQAILDDLNTQVFRPMREQLKKGSDGVPVLTSKAPAAPKEPLVPPMKLVETAKVVQTQQRPPLPPAPVNVSEPSVRTMSADMEAVKEHREPTSTPLSTSNPVPLPPQPTASPRTAPPPPNLPGAPVAKPLEKSYAVDPYREPIE